MKDPERSQRRAHRTIGNEKQNGFASVSLDLWHAAEVVPSLTPPPAPWMSSGKTATIKQEDLTTNRQDLFQKFLKCNFRYIEKL